MTYPNSVSIHLNSEQNSQLRDMNLTRASNLETSAISSSPSLALCRFQWPVSFSPTGGRLTFPFRKCPFPPTPKEALTVHARKRNSGSDPVLKPALVEEVSAEDEEEEDLLYNDVEDDSLMDGDDDDFEEEYVEDNAEVYVGDGEEGGGILLAGTWWDKEALAIAEEVILSFEGDLKIYAFKTFSNSTIRVRIEKLSNKSGSPNMEDIEGFSTSYRDRLDEAEIAKSIPENIYVEVSSPGVERVVRIPYELDRFKDRAMYVKYINEGDETGSSSVSDGVFRLVSFDTETKSCTWGIADVRLNREKAGKGRPLNRKQRDWRLITPFESLLLVRLYCDI